MSLLNRGQYLQMKREQFNWNKSEAAQRIGANIASVTNWEANQSISPSACHKIIKAYKLTDEEIEKYGMRKQRKSDRVKIKSLISNVQMLKSDIDANMRGLSKFEQSIKNKALATLERVRVMLKEISIVDEALL